VTSDQVEQPAQGYHLEEQTEVTSKRQKTGNLRVRGFGPVIDMVVALYQQRNFFEYALLVGSHNSERDVFNR
jgi:hypothetical protein